MDFGAGTALMASAISVLNSDSRNKLKSFVSDYAAVTFLAVSQAYSNIPDHLQPTIKEGFFSFLTGMGGLCFATFVHNLATRNLAQVQEAIPFAQSTHASGQYEGRQNRFSVLFPRSTTQRKIAGVALTLFGAASIAVGTALEEAALLRDFGVIITSYGLAEFAFEHARKKAMERRDLEADPSSAHLSRYYSFARRFLNVAHIVPGIFIAAAGGVSKMNQSQAVKTTTSIAMYALTGFFLGGKSHLEMARFTECPRGELDELNKKDVKKTGSEKAFYRFKQLFSFAVIPTFIGMAIAGIDTSNGKFDQGSLSTTLAMTSFGLALYGSYGVAHLAKKAFKTIPGRSGMWTNTAYLWTHYSPGVPLLALYILEKFKIGDKTLDHDPTLALTLGCIAYWSLGWGLGNEAKRRGEYPHPRSPSALTVALIGNFIGQRMLGQV